MTEPPLTLTRKGIPRRGTEGGVDGTSPCVFDMLPYFETILP